jgi:hypothetical protein
MACTTEMQGFTVLETYTRNPLLTPDCHEGRSSGPRESCATVQTLGGESVGNPGTRVVSEPTGIPVGFLGRSRVACLTGIRSACPPAVEKLPGRPPTRR